MKFKWSTLGIFSGGAAIGAAMLYGATATAAASSCGSDVISGVRSASSQSLAKVGETRLRVMLFRIYDAELYSDTGSYSQADERLLRLNYARSFTSERLAEQTRDEWERIGFPENEKTGEWINTLKNIWPDVNSGDCIVAHQLPNGAVRFYGNEGELGAIEDQQFGEQFLAIWLSENARFRSSRDELVGEK